MFFLNRPYLASKYAKHLEKNGWTDICRINPGPRFDPFTSHAQIYVTFNVDNVADSEKN